VANMELDINDFLIPFEDLLREAEVEREECE
jgi:hypothetical protein